MSRRQLISDHAVVRFLERHDGRDLASVRNACGGALAHDMAILDHLAAHEGLDVAAVRRRMMTPAVGMALAMGAAGVRMGRIRLIIVAGTVVTVRLTAWDRISPRAKPWGRPSVRREHAVDWGGGHDDAHPSPAVPFRKRPLRAGARSRSGGAALLCGQARGRIGAVPQASRVATEIQAVRDASLGAYPVR